MSRGDLIAPASAPAAVVEMMAVWHSPFLSLGGAVRMHPEGATIAEIVAGFGGDLPARFGTHGIVTIDGHVIERRFWGRVRPMARARGSRRPVTIALTIPLEGGGGGNTTRKVVGTLAMVALAILTMGIKTGMMASGGLFAAGSLSAALLSASVAAVGSLAIRMLTAAPVRSLAAPASKERTERGAASAEGNVLRPGAPVPAVIGTRRIYPVQASQPLITVDDDDNETVEAVYLLAGPHRLSEIRIGEAAIADAEDVEVQTREGWPEDPPIDLFARHGAMDTPQIELSAHAVSADDQALIEDTLNPARGLPRWHAVASRRGGDEVHVQLVLPEGLIWRDAATTPMRLPLRLRIRPRGTADWIHLPELHFRAAEQSQMRLAIELRYDEPETLPPLPDEEGFVAAYKAVPVQPLQPVGSGWTADGYFSAGSGGDVLAAGAGGSNVRHVALTARRALVYLDPGLHPKGVWEIEVMRGCVVRADTWGTAAYTTGGVVRDLFGYVAAGGPTIANSRSQLGERAYLMRVVTIVNRLPVSRAGVCATIAVRAVNRQVDQLSVLASRWVRDWDGTGWHTWTTTSNPVPHYVDTLIGPESPEPVELAELDLPALLTWRQRCIDEGYSCDLIAEATTQDDLRRMIAACGWARPAVAELYSVVEDHDRSAEAPVQVFTPRTMRGFSFARGLERQPDGFRVEFDDAEADYKPTQIMVYRPGVTASRLVEQVRMEGLVSEARARARAEFDLAQTVARATTYRFEASVNALRCRRGSLIGVQHPILTRRTASARVRAVLRGADGLVARIQLDSQVPVVGDGGDLRGVTDLREVADLRDLGGATGIAVVGPDGETRVYALADPSGVTDLVTLSTPAPAEEIAEGCLVAIGPLGQEYLRLIVTSIRWRRQLVAAIEAVDEAPELVRG